MTCADGWTDGRLEHLDEYSAYVGGSLRAKKATRAFAAAISYYRPNRLPPVAAEEFDITFRYVCVWYVQ